MAEIEGFTAVCACGKPASIFTIGEDITAKCVDCEAKEVVLPSGECFFHFCEAASYRDQAAGFCGEAAQDILDMTECPRGLWFKRKDGFPVERKAKKEAETMPEPEEE